MCVNISSLNWFISLLSFFVFTFVSLKLLFDFNIPTLYSTEFGEEWISWSLTSPGLLLNKIRRTSPNNWTKCLEYEQVFTASLLVNTCLWRNGSTYYKHRGATQGTNSVSSQFILHAMGLLNQIRRCYSNTKTTKKLPFSVSFLNFCLPLPSCVSFLSVKSIYFVILLQGTNIQKLKKKLLLEHFSSFRLLSTVISIWFRNVLLFHFLRLIFWIFINPAFLVKEWIVSYNAHVQILNI